MAVDDPRLPTPVRDALDAWLQCHDERAPGLIEGLYVVGSVALDDWHPGSDIDIVAFTGYVPTGSDAGALRDAHAAAVRRTGGVDVDGPRLAWSDVAAPPEPLARPWTLHGDFRHDDACFELNPVVWHTLGHHGVAVRGPEPHELDIALDAPALHAFVVGNTDTYWRAVTEQVAIAASSPTPPAFVQATTTWCVLGVARMFYTAHTGAIASKSEAGRWVNGLMPDHADLVDRALRARTTPSTDAEPQWVVEQTASFMRAVIDAVGRAG